MKERLVDGTNRQREGVRKKNRRGMAGTTRNLGEGEEDKREDREWMTEREKVVKRRELCQMWMKTKEKKEKNESVRRGVRDGKKMCQ